MGELTGKESRLQGAAMSILVAILILSPSLGVAQGWLDDAEMSITERDFETAITLLHGGIEQDPKSAEAYYLLGMALKGSRRTDEAFSAFQRALKIQKKFVKPRYELGMLQIENGQYEEAEATFQKGIKKRYEPSGPLNYGIGMVKLAMDSVRAATIYFTRASQDDPYNPAYYKAMGDIYARQKVTELAVNEYNRALELDPKAADIHYAIGKLYFKDRDWAEVLKAWKTAIASDSTFVPVYADLIDLYLIMNPPRYGDAVPLLEKAVKFHPDEPKYKVELARAMAKTKAYRKAALPFLEKANLLAPDDVEILVLIGDLSLAEKDFGRAVQSYRKATQLDPNYVGALKGLAEAQKASGDTTAAISTLQEVAGKDTSSEGGGVEGALGLLLYKQERYVEAIPNLKEKLQASPEIPFLYSLLGKCYIKMKDYGAIVTEVIPALDRAVVTYPDEKRLSGVYSELGIELFNAKHYNEAIKLFEKRLIHDPDNWSVHLNIGYANFQKKSYPHAVRCFKKVVTLKPNHAQAHFLLGACYRYLENIGRAKSAFLKAVKLDPKNVEAQKQVGLSYLLESQDLRQEEMHKESQELASRASTFFRKAVSLKSRDVQARVWLAQAYAMSKQIDKAKETFRKVLNMDPENEDAQSGLERLEGGY